MIKNVNVKKVIAGGFSGIVFSLFLLLVFSVILRFTDVPVDTSDLFAVVASVAGLLLSGMVAAAGTTSAGWLSGGLSGALYVVLLSVSALILNGLIPVLRFIITIVVGFVTGAAGGIIGINFKFKKFGKRRG